MPPQPHLDFPLLQSRCMRRVHTMFRPLFHLLLHQLLKTSSSKNFGVQQIQRSRGGWCVCVVAVPWKLPCNRLKSVLSPGNEMCWQHLTRFNNRVVHSCHYRHYAVEAFATLILSLVNSEHVFSSWFLGFQLQVSGRLTVSPWPHLAHLSGQLPRAAPTCHVWNRAEFPPPRHRRYMTSQMASEA